MDSIRLSSPILTSIYSTPFLVPTYPTQPPSTSSKPTAKKTHKKLLTTEFFSPHHKHESFRDHHSSSKEQHCQESLKYLKHLTLMSLSHHKSPHLLKNRVPKIMGNSFIKQRYPPSKEKPIDTPKMKKRTKWSQFDITRRETAGQSKEQRTTHKKRDPDQGFISTLEEYISSLMSKRTKNSRKTVHKNSKVGSLNMCQQKLRLLEQKQREEIQEMKRRSYVLEGKVKELDREVVSLKVHVNHEIGERKRCQEMYLNLKKRMELERGMEESNEQLLSYQGSGEESISSQLTESPRYNVKKFNQQPPPTKHKFKRLSQDM